MLFRKILACLCMSLHISCMSLRFFSCLLMSLQFYAHLLQARIFKFIFCELQRNKIFKTPLPSSTSFHIFSISIGRTIGEQRLGLHIIAGVFYTSLHVIVHLLHIFCTFFKSLNVIAVFS